MANSTYPPITIDPKSDPKTPAYRVKVPAALEHNVFNDNTMLGLSIGSAAALTIGVLTGGATMVGGVALAGIGALVGNWVDERKFKDSQDNGIEVKPEGFINKGLFSGLLTGFSAGSLMLAAKSLVHFLPEALSAPLSGILGGTIMGVGAPLVVGLGVAAVVGTIGAIHYMNSSRHQYEGVQVQFQEQTQRIHTMERALLKARAAGIETPPLLAERDPELQFTAYAHPADAWHPVQERAQDGQKFADTVRGRGYARSTPASGAALATDAIDTQTLAEKVQALRESNGQTLGQIAVG